MHICIYAYISSSQALLIPIFKTANCTGFEFLRRERKLNKSLHHLHQAIFEHRPTL